MNMIEFDGKYYALDINRLITAVFENKEVDKTKDRSKVETWGLASTGEGNEPEFRVIQKEVSESNSDSNENYASYRYDLVKNLLNLILSPLADENGGIMRINTLDEMYFGQMIAFNTLVNEGILIEVNED
jgi:hypothetical protein